MKIIKITNKVSKTGKNYKEIDLEIENSIVTGSMWEENNNAEGDKVDWNVVKKGNFTNFYAKNSNETKETSNAKYYPTHPMTLERLDKVENAIKRIIKHLNLEVEAEKTEIETVLESLPQANPEDIPF